MKSSSTEAAKTKSSRWHVSRHAWLLFVATVIIGSLTTRVPLFVWIAPILFLLFIDKAPKLIAFVLFFLFAIINFVMTQKGVIPLPDEQFYAMGVVIGVIGFIPFWLQVAVKNRLPGLLVPLVFPCANVALEFAASTGDFGSWGSLAYSQAGNLTLMQLVSVTGVWGITFFMCWTASTAWWVLSRYQRSDRLLRPESIAYICAAIVIVTFGQYRLTNGRAMLSLPNDGQQVACVVAPKGPNTPDFMMQWLNSARDDQSATNPDASESATADTTASLLAKCGPFVNTELDYLLRKSAEQAQAGAKLIVWSEGALSLPPELEADVLQRCSEFAKANSTNLAMTLAVLKVTDTPGKFIDNKIVFVSDDGTVSGEYRKTNTVPGEPSMNGDGVIPSFDTKSVGRISPLVCFDADFPGFVSQVGRGTIDTQQLETIVVSANDWKEVSDQHMQMSAFRAVENGMWVVRSTSRGTSAVISPLGEVQARVSAFEHAEPTLSGWVSGGRMATWYPTLGDLFAKASCVGFILLIIAAMFMGKRRPHPVEA